MTSGAKVGSVEALDSFRSSLIVYISKARPSLEEIGAEVMRSRMWLENDQRIHWETQVRRRAQTLETARQELFAAGISVCAAAPRMKSGPFAGPKTPWKKPKTSSTASRNGPATSTAKPRPWSSNWKNSKPCWPTTSPRPSPIWQRHQNPGRLRIKPPAATHSVR